MQFEKKLKSVYASAKMIMRLFLPLSLVFILGSCTTFIPGLDRILFSNSSAKVGPIVTVEEEYPENQAKEVAMSSSNDSSSRPEAMASETITEVESDSLMANGHSANQAGEITHSKPVITKNDVGTPSTVKAISSESSEPELVNVKPTPTPKPATVLPEGKPNKQSIDTSVDFGIVSGTVVLIGDDQQLLPTLGTMITLTPTTMINSPSDRPSEVHIIDMEDKTYQPRYSTIQAGDQVVFVNKDNIRHNVFSSSGGNSFDLGTYGAGLKRAVTLKEPGIVKIYCNIHAEMATFVAVGNQGLSAKADAQGHYQFNKVLPGTYEATIWNIRGETKRLIDVKADETIKLIDRIDTAAFQVETHKNKFGGNYSKNSALFEDEFY